MHELCLNALWAVHLTTISKLLRPKPRCISTTKSDNDTSWRYGKLPSGTYVDQTWICRRWYSKYIDSRTAHVVKPREAYSSRIIFRTTIHELITWSWNHKLFIVVEHHGYRTMNKMINRSVGTSNTVFTGDMLQKVQKLKQCEQNLLIRKWQGGSSMQWDKVLLLLHHPRNSWMLGQRVIPRPLSEGFQ